MNFRKITLEDKGLIDSYLAKYPCYGSTYSMAYLSSWTYFGFDNMMIADEGDALVFKFNYKGDTLYLAGLTSKDNFPSLVDRIMAYDNDAVIVQAEMRYTDLLDGDKYEIEHNIDYDEYLYAPSDLITLSGKKYHGKRGHIKKFMRLYDGYVFRDYEPKDRDAVMRLFSEWEENKGIEIDSERAVILNMLDNFDLFGLVASLIEVDGKVIGFTMGELMSSNIGVVHIEKGDIEYEGIYPVINMLFAAKYFADCKYINRQEDVGVEGLRKAKRSYYPVRMSEKCNIRRKKD